MPENPKRRTDKALRVSEFQADVQILALEDNKVCLNRAVKQDVIPKSTTIIRHSALPSILKEKKKKSYELQMNCRWRTSFSEFSLIMLPSCKMALWGEGNH